MNLPRFQFTIRRALHVTFWFAVASGLFVSFPTVGYPHVAHLLAFIAAIGAALGAIVGHPIYGAAIMLFGCIAYAYCFPDARA